MHYRNIAEDGKDHFPTSVNFYMKKIINSLTSEHIILSLFEKITCGLKKMRFKLTKKILPFKKHKESDPDGNSIRRKEKKDCYRSFALNLSTSGVKWTKQSDSLEISAELQAKLVLSHDHKGPNRQMFPQHFIGHKVCLLPT